MLDARCTRNSGTRGPDEPAPVDRARRRGGNAAKTLENTKWLLVDLRAGTVVTDSAHYVAAITLTPAGHTVTGNGGCNTLAGGYSRTARTA